MVIYKCSKCKSYLGRINNYKSMDFKAKRGITIEDNILILKCKCGEITKIDMTEFFKNNENINP